MVLLDAVRQLINDAVSLFVDGQSIKQRVNLQAELSGPVTSDYPTSITRVFDFRFVDIIGNGHHLACPLPVGLFLLLGEVRVGRRDLASPARQVGVYFR